ncbi:MAG: NifB/NifX family molybdenum-iron cluster-binding protein [Clostridia bacterium]|nr:NifB/NifX family molybdenum-iron cluster-binding protein [Clostridia bacterium]
MKIAVTFNDGEIFQHFGRTESFKIYETENGAVTGSCVIGTDGIGHEDLIGFLKDRGIDVLICGGMGMGARMAFEDSGIEIIPGAEGNADEAILSYLKGELVTDSEKACCHGEGHGHGEHDCKKEHDTHNCHC